MSGVLVLGVNVYQKKDGTYGARVVVASTPRNAANYRGLLAAEVDALPEVADTMKVFPAWYRLEFDYPIANGYGGRASEVRPVVVGATLLAAAVPEKKEVKPA